MIVVAGEALVDLIGEPDGRYRPVPGGSPANVAVGLARLGARTELLARLGTGVLGDLVRAHLTGNGVGLTHAAHATEPVTLAAVSLDETGRTRYDFYVDGTAAWAWRSDELPAALPGSATALCTGSLAIALPPGAVALTELIHREHERGEVTVIIDPNIRPALLGPRPAGGTQLLDVLVATDVVKASDEDLAWLEPGVPFEQVASRWLELGPALVVVTLGERGAYAVTRHGAAATVPARPVDVVDTVGAGDAFTAGLVDSLRRRDLLGHRSRDLLAAVDADALTEIVDEASLVAAITCSRRGADPPTADELAELRGNSRMSLHGDAAGGDT